MKILQSGFMLVTLWITACTQMTDAKIERERLQKAIDTFYAAIANGDEDTRFALYADSIYMLPNFGSYIQGKTRLEKVWRASRHPGEKKYVFRIKNLNRLETHISGDAAYTINDYYYTYHAEGDEPVWKKTKNIHIWRKQPDNSWKLHADIWNSSERQK